MSVHGGVAPLWVRQGPTYWTGPGGCQVAACRLGPGSTARWRFSAWGPAELPELSYWQWQEAIKPPVTYARGEAVARRRPCLGVHATAAAARAACLDWLAGQETRQAGLGADPVAMAAAEAGGAVDGVRGALDAGVTAVMRTEG